MRYEAKNITVRVSCQTYDAARVYAAQHGCSVSAIVSYLLARLPAVSQAIRILEQQFPDFEDRARTPALPAEKHPSQNAKTR